MPVLEVFPDAEVTVQNTSPHINFSSNVLQQHASSTVLYTTTCICSYDIGTGIGAPVLSPLWMVNLWPSQILFKSHQPQPASPVARNGVDVV